MKISVIIPSNRTSDSALARVFETSTLDPDRFELIVRDNSENAKKRSILEMIGSKTLKLYSVPNRGGFENSIEALQLATGEFALFLADDDWISSRGLLQLHALGSQGESDRTVIGATGAFLIETTTATGLLKYSDLDAQDACKRLTGFLKANGPNVLYYSAIRRDLMVFCFRFMEALPYKFSFHDQLMCVMYLAMGRVLQTDRIVYHYDQSDWETLDGTLAKDRTSYVNSGLPIEVDRLHWLICGMEGALLLNSNLLRERASFDRVQLANVWFSANFMRFKHWRRESGYAETPSNAITMKIRDKWLDNEQVNLNELLLDVCSAFEVTDEEGARRYFDFWSTV